MFARRQRRRQAAAQQVFPSLENSHMILICFNLPPTLAPLSPTLPMLLPCLHQLQQQQQQDERTVSISLFTLCRQMFSLMFLFFALDFITHTQRSISASFALGLPPPYSPPTLSLARNEFIKYFICDLVEYSVTSLNG